MGFPEAATHATWDKSKKVMQTSFSASDRQDGAGSHDPNAASLKETSRKRYFLCLLAASFGRGGRKHSKFKFCRPTDRRPTRPLPLPITTAGGPIHIHCRCRKSSLLAAARPPPAPLCYHKISPAAARPWPTAGKKSPQNRRRLPACLPAFVLITVDSDDRLVVGN